MDFGSGQGGSDGCLDFDDHDNKGLQKCLYEGEFGVSILQAYQEHCTTISLADFIVIAAEAVMMESRKHAAPGPNIDFKSGFKYGRTTAETCPWALGRLPNPEDGCPANDETFVKRMGLTWSETAALMGVHTLGRALPDNSGYNGFWSDSKNSRRFNNDYYNSLLDKGWRPERVNGNPQKNQWFRADMGRDDRTLGKEMMLNTDLCLAYKNGGRGLFADKELAPGGSKCCTWRMASNDGPWIPPPTNIYYEVGAPHCGNPDPFTDTGIGFGEQRFECCGSDIQFSDCGDPFFLEGDAFEAVKAFALSETEWLRVFLVAWRKSTSNGMPNLKPLSSR